MEGRKGNFQVNFTCFVALSPASIAELKSFWYSLNYPHLCASKRAKLFQTIKTNDVTSDRREMDLRRRLRTA